MYKQYEFDDEDTDYTHSYENDNTEKKAYDFLIDIGCKNIKRVDTDKDFMKQISKNLLTPDFIISDKNFEAKYFTNNPNDLYVDVAELTGAMWNNTKNNKSALKDGNFVNVIKGNSENIEKSTKINFENSSNFSINEIDKNYKIEKMIELNKKGNPTKWSVEQHNPEIIRSLWEPFNKKVKKYGTKRGSKKVGIIFVESPKKGITQLTHFTTMIWTLFESIKTTLYYRKYITENEARNIEKLRMDLLSLNITGNIVIAGHWGNILSNLTDNLSMPLRGIFKHNDWLFFTLLGNSQYKDFSITLINYDTYSIHKGDNTYEIKWITNLLNDAYWLYDKYKPYEIALLNQIFK